MYLVGSRDKQGYNPIKYLPVSDSTNVTRVLIFAYFRSGSSFLGDLLQQNWKTFYQFEPLQYMSKSERINRQNSTEAYNVINGILNCDFNVPNSYGNIIERNTVVSWNKFLRSISRVSRLADDIDFASQVCIRSKYIVVKTVRIPFIYLEEWSRLMEMTNLKVILLVRDPRGIYNSRRFRGWCSVSQQCSNISSICSEMQSDLKSYNKLKSLYPNKLTMLRYEDLVTNPFEESRSLFSFLNMDFSYSVKRFLKTHTNSQVKNTENTNPYSTYRQDSMSTAFRWMKQLNESELLDASQYCDSVLTQLNYSSDSSCC